MPYCPSCGAEFRAGYIQCNTCLVALVDSLEALDEESEEEVEAGEGTLHLLSTFTDESQVGYVRRLLDEVGIPSVIQGGHTPRVGDCIPYRLYVDESYVEAARETVESYHSPSLVIGEIEGHLDRLDGELRRIERSQTQAGSELEAVRKSIEQLRTDLDALNRTLNEEE